MTVPGYHFIQEDAPAGIGRAVTHWLTALGQKPDSQARPWTDRKFVRLGLTDLEMYHFMSIFCDANRPQLLEGGTMPILNAEEPAVRR